MELTSRALAGTLTCGAHLGAVCLLIQFGGSPNLPPHGESRALTVRFVEPESKTASDQRTRQLESLAAMGSAAMRHEPERLAAIPAPRLLQMDADGSEFSQPSLQSSRAELTSQARLVRDDYQRTLLAHIARFRTYPYAAKVNRTSGVVQVRFSLSRDGSVLDAWVARSSGSALLDREALATLFRAQPLPNIPDGLPARLELELPVSFRLRAV